MRCLQKLFISVGVIGPQPGTAWGSTDLAGLVHCDKTHAIEKHVWIPLAEAIAAPQVTLLALWVYNEGLGEAEDETVHRTQISGIFMPPLLVIKLSSPSKPHQASSVTPRYSPAILTNP